MEYLSDFRSLWILLKYNMLLIRLLGQCTYQYRSSESLIKPKFLVRLKTMMWRMMTPMYLYCAHWHTSLIQPTLGTSLLYGIRPKIWSHLYLNVFTIGDIFDFKPIQILSHPWSKQYEINQGMLHLERYLWVPKVKSKSITVTIHVCLLLYVTLVVENMNDAPFPFNTLPIWNGQCFL